MAQTDDQSEKTKSGEQSSTVPDIFASMSEINEIPSDFTLMKLSDAAQIKFPGIWTVFESPGTDSSSVSFRQADSISALISCGLLSANDKTRLCLNNLCLSPARAFQPDEWEELHICLSSRRPKDKYEIKAGSIELLQDKPVLVIMGFFRHPAIKEALVIFPCAKGYGYLALQAIILEFPIYFNHLRHALKNVEWF